MSRSPAAARAAQVDRAVQEFTRAVAGTPVRVTFNDGDRANTTGMDRVFVQLGLTLASLPDLLRGPGVAAIRQEFTQNFADESGRKRWARLAPATVRDRVAKGYGRGPILQRTGRLKRHVITAPAQIRSGGGVVELRIAPSANVGGRPYYRAQALGTSRIPSRPMVVLRPAAANRVTSAISREARRRAQSNGLG